MSPAEQAALRTKLRKERGGKRGRPKTAKKDQGDDGVEGDDQDEDEPPAKRKRRAKKKGAVAESSSSDGPASPVNGSKGGKVGAQSKKGKTKDNNKSKTKNKTKGKEIKGKDASDQGKTFGCSRCRYAAKGCVTCKAPNFKPRGPRKSKSK